MEQSNQNLKICLSCANIYACESGSAEIWTCPACGTEIRADTYEPIMREARDAVQFGWNYRRRYERDLRERGRIDTHYSLAPYDEILSFIALAVISGIVGGASYDAAKAALRKILDFAGQKGRRGEESRIFSLIDNREDMELFLRYIDEYYTSFDEIDEAVRNAVFEEMVVDQISPTLERIIMAHAPDLDLEKIEEISPFSEEEIFKSMMEVRREVDRRRQRRGKIPGDLWRELNR